MILYKTPVVRRVAIAVQSRMVRRTRGFQFGEGLRVFGWPIMRCVEGAQVVVGRNLSLVSHSDFSAPGISRPCMINAMDSGAKITIGDDVGMSGVSICSAMSVTIGDRVMLGADAVVTDTDFHPIDVVPRRYVETGIGVAPVLIEKDAFIGMRAIILKGVKIGEGAVVAAGTVVASDVPAFSIFAGQPGRVVKGVNAQSLIPTV